MLIHRVLALRYLQRASMSLLLMLCAADSAIAEEVKTEVGGRTINANLEIADGKTLSDGAVLIFHALMQHYGSEIIQGLQEGLKEAGRNSLAVTLSMGLDNRLGSYECSTPHRYLFDEGTAWLQWLKARDVAPVALLGHSLGANQALGLTVESYDPIVSALVLLSPMTMGRERLFANYKTRYRVALDEVSS